MHRMNLVLIAVTIALIGGCTSTGDKMVQSYAKTRDTLNAATNQVDMTISTMLLLRVAQGPEVKDAFEQYKKAVAQLAEEGDNAKRRAVAMKTEADEHVKAWEREMETISDPQIKSTMETRRRAVRSNFKLVQMYAQDARKAYGPFLQGNQQIVKALMIDLSPAAMTSLAPVMDRVVSDGGTLKQNLVAMQRAMDNIANGISPIGDVR